MSVPRKKRKRTNTTNGETMVKKSGTGVLTPGSSPAIPQMVPHSDSSHTTEKLPKMFSSPHTHVPSEHTRMTQSPEEEATSLPMEEDEPGQSDVADSPSTLGTSKELG